MTDTAFATAGMLLKHLIRGCDGQSVSLSYESCRFIYMLSAERLYYARITESQMMDQQHQLSKFADDIIEEWEQITDGRLDQVLTEGIEECFGDHEPPQEAR